jgi:curved DNA-binding protein CbpA
MPDHYKVLGVSREADRHAIQVAYRRLARRHHPDFGGDARIMAVLNDAWSVLGDRDRRDAYDQARPRRSATRPIVKPEPAGPLAAAAERRRPSRHPQETTLGFGRYAGWTIRALAVADPYYLEWLMRSQAGRVYRPEIVTVLQEQQVARSPVVAAVKERPRRMSLRRR